VETLDDGVWFVAPRSSDSQRRARRQRLSAEILELATYPGIKYREHDAGGELYLAGCETLLAGHPYRVRREAVDTTPRLRSETAISRVQRTTSRTALDIAACREPVGPRFPTMSIRIDGMCGAAAYTP
jgi:hypothetical protein